MSVILPATMKRLLKQYSGLHRIETAAAMAACVATDAWIEGVVKRVVTIAREQELKTIDVHTVLKALGSEVLSSEPSHMTWCKTRMRDRIKALSPGFRWSLAAKQILYASFEDYLRLLSSRIAITQKLCNRNTISKDHVIAAINYR
jgi:histone H3/H4